jgi:hypothetical protein
MFITENNCHEITWLAETSHVKIDHYGCIWFNRVLPPFTINLHSRFSQVNLYKV